jgi:DNA-3-methyladenine glycosylase
VEPVNGLEAMSMNRYGKRLSELSDRDKINLTNGPGKLCMALNITRKDNGEDLCNSRLYIADEINDSREKTIEDSDIISTKRINIDYAEEAADYPWRFYIKGNKYVSRK